MTKIQTWRKNWTQPWMEENDEGINDNLLDQSAPVGISEDSLD
jgi:hypothetical protein